VKGEETRRTWRKLHLDVDVDTHERLSADGAYDTKSCHNTLKNGTIAEWGSESGYHYCSISETAMSRNKGLTSGKLSLRCHNAQVGEIMANVKAINKSHKARYACSKLTVNHIWRRSPST
jgi:hypothetical protein